VRETKWQLLDPRKVRRQRLAVGYSERVLSGILGVSNRVIDRIEGGHDQGNLDVRFIARLAKALACQPAELLQDDDPPTAGDDGDPDACDPTDLAVVGALLASDRTEVNIDVAALSLGWTRDRVLVALLQLGPALARLGQRLSWLGDYSVRLVAAPVCERTESAARRAEIAVNGLDIDSAGMIHLLVVTGRPARLGDWDPMRRNRLVHAGVLDLDHSAATSSHLPIELSADTRYALALDDAALAHRQDRLP
jgi:transcriptional regulator with XRE-family HTH domain